MQDSLAAERSEMHMAFAQEQGARPITAATPDDELARRAVNGDGAAFTTIMRRHNRLLFRTARSILKCDADAEDALQDGYLRAWRGLGTFRGDAKLSTWLVRIVANEALAHHRRKRLSVVPLEDAMTTTEPGVRAALSGASAQMPDRVAMRAEIRKLLEMRIDRLPEAFRTVFVLRAIEELSVEEVAEVLDIPSATVRTRFFRAKGFMRESLASEIDETLGEAFAYDGDRCDRMVASVLARAQVEGLAEKWLAHSAW